MNQGIANILNEFDSILQDDANLSTRSGLRLAMSVLREATTTLGDLQDRLEVVENERRDEKEKKSVKVDEALWLRRQMYGVALAAMIMLFINGGIFLITTMPFFRAMISLAQP